LQFFIDNLHRSTKNEALEGFLTSWRAPKLPAPGHLRMIRMVAERKEREKAEYESASRKKRT